MKLSTVRNLCFHFDVEFNLPSVQLSGHELLKLRQNVKEAIERAHISQSLYYNQGRKEVFYQKGDLVLIYKPNRQIGKSSKFLPNWFGPFLITRKMSDLNYEVKDIREKPGRKLFDIVPVVRMKSFYCPGQRKIY